MYSNMDLNLLNMDVTMEGDHRHGTWTSTRLRTGLLDLNRDAVSLMHWEANERRTLC